MLELVTGTGWPPMAAAFLVSLIETLAALGFLLTAGAEHGRFQALIGACLAPLAFAVAIVAFGAAAWCIPPDLVQLILGTLLLFFGLRLLRQAVLWAGGVIGAEEQATAYRHAMSRLRWHAREGTASVERIIVASIVTLVAPRAVAVAFIVIALGAAGGAFAPPALGALAGFVAAAPLASALYWRPIRFTRTAIEFLGGAAAAAFGTFWCGVGIGARWLGDEWTVLPLAGVFLGMAAMLVPLARSRVKGLV